MLKKFALGFVLAGFCASPALAGEGLACVAGKMMMADMAPAQCGAAMEACGVTFETKGGYFAIAQSEDGLGYGAGTGFRKAEGAAERAMSVCAGLDAGACSVVIEGKDDGMGGISCGPHAAM